MVRFTMNSSGILNFCIIVYILSDTLKENIIAVFANFRTKNYFRDSSDDYETTKCVRLVF